MIGALAENHRPGGTGPPEPRPFVAAAPPLRSLLCKGGNSAPAAILKSGTRGEKLFRDRSFIPFLFAKNIFLGSEGCDQNREKGEN